MDVIQGEIISPPKSILQSKLEACKMYSEMQLNSRYLEENAHDCKYNSKISRLCVHAVMDSLSLQVEFQAVAA